MLLRILIGTSILSFFVNASSFVESPFANIFNSRYFSTTIISDKCLQCLCEVSTGCHSNTKCIENENRCGPFLITKPYWIDAGQFTINDENPDSPTAFKNCAIDPHCAVKSIRSYTSKFAQDCNGDGITNDSDFILIHHLGRYGCKNNTLDPQNRRLIENCMKNIL